MKLKPCPKCETLCHVEIIITAAKAPKNIRIGCLFHGFWLPDCFCTADEAAEAWNRRASDVFPKI